MQGVTGVGSTASSGQSCSLHGGTNFCTLNYKLKSLKALKAFAETKAKSKHNKGIKIASEQTNKRKQNCQQRRGGGGSDGDSGCVYLCCSFALGIQKIHFRKTILT